MNQRFPNKNLSLFLPRLGRIKSIDLASHKVCDEISFVGGVGGILGLFLGFSFISAVEVFYVFVCKLTALKASQCIERRSKRNRVTSHSNLMSVKGHQERY